MSNATSECILYSAFRHHSLPLFASAQPVWLELLMSGAAAPGSARPTSILRWLRREGGAGWAAYSGPAKGRWTVQDERGAWGLRAASRGAGRGRRQWERSASFQPGCRRPLSSGRAGGGCEPWGRGGLAWPRERSGVGEGLAIMRRAAGGLYCPGRAGLAGRAGTVPDPAR